MCACVSCVCVCVCFCANIYVCIHQVNDLISHRSNRHTSVNENMSKTNPLCSRAPAVGSLMVMVRRGQNGRLMT